MMLDYPFHQGVGATGSTTNDVYTDSTARGIFVVHLDLAEFLVGDTFDFNVQTQSEYSGSYKTVYKKSFTFPDVLEAYQSEPVVALQGLNVQIDMTSVTTRTGVLLWVAKIS